jgi:hypothetical protein
MTPQTTERNPITEVRNITGFIDTPVLALHKPTGKPVYLIASGDSPGHSPVNQYVDQNRRMQWGVADDFEILEARLIPPSLDMLQGQLKALNDAGSRR